MLCLNFPSIFPFFFSLFFSFLPLTFTKIFNTFTTASKNLSFFLFLSNQTCHVRDSFVFFFLLLSSYFRLTTIFSYYWDQCLHLSTWFQALYSFQFIILSLSCLTLYWTASCYHALRKLDLQSYWKESILLLSLRFLLFLHDYKDVCHDIVFYKTAFV